MSVFLDLAYVVGGVFAAPLLLRKRMRTGKYRSGLAGRFGFGQEPVPAAKAGEKMLLVHCVSVGEVNSVGTLLMRLLAADERLRIVITTGTDTGTERARKLYGGQVLPTPSPAGGSGADALVGWGGGGERRMFPVRFPLDFSYAVKRLLDRVKPDAIALVELETWPNFLQIAQRRRIPVVVINGRISERSFPRYRLIRPLMASMLRRISWIGAQTDTIAERFVRLGGDRGRVEVIPTLKYDNAQVAQAVAGQEQLAAAMGLSPDHRLFVAGSTGPGEEKALLVAYEALRVKHPDLRLAIVPRHPEVVPRVIEAIKRAGLTPVLRTERPDGGQIENGKWKMEKDEVFVLNTMGELRKLYALAFAVFVGRSLLKKGGGGSDMIEVAALGKPCCFGPYTANFAEVVEMLTREKGAVEVKDAADLTRVVGGWLTEPQGTAAMGRRAQELIRSQQQAHATDRYVERILQLVR